MKSLRISLIDKTVNLIADIVSATLDRAEPTASSLQAVPGNSTRTQLRGRRKNKAKTQELSSDPGLQCRRMYPAAEPGADSTKHSLFKNQDWGTTDIYRVGQEKFTGSPKIQDKEV